MTADDDGDGKTYGRSSPSADRPVLRSRGYRQHGLTLGLPLGWSSTGRDGIVRISSPDSSVALAVLSTSPERTARSALRDMERSIRRSYRNARVVRRGVRTTLAGRPGLSTRISLRRGSRRLDVVLIGARSRWRTYAVTVFGRTPAPEARIAETRRVLGSLRFERPRG